jgi:glutathione peroxidase|tara:strand:+ start:213 stop:704 length:492 start_codon:yes stop_codon:yes gene_type:complete
MANNAYDYNFTSINEEDVINLSDYKGKTIVVVNTASLCGFTYQYEGLQSLYAKYKDEGLVVIGVPSNQFLQEEPGDEKQIKEFCESTFGITFPLTVKSKVRGSDAHPFYKWARNELSFIAGVPRWNFHKIIIDKNGNAAAGYTALTKPSSKKFINKIEELLSL